MTRSPPHEDGLSNVEPVTTRLRYAGPVFLAAAYYFGAQIGFALQAPNAPQSILWLPNSILLAVLIALPRRQWPIYLAAAFPAQMLLALGGDAPPLNMGLLYVTNCADAALGALLVQRLSGQGSGFEFDGLRPMLVFACAATCATLALSFADAGISVATGWAADYSAAFSTRVRSNVLTHLMTVPVVIDLWRVEWRGLKTARIVEVSVLTALVVATCGVAFGQSGSFDAVPAILYVPLPLLLWAAVRFGPGATGWTVLLVAFVASWQTLHNLGPFSLRPAADSVVSLQLFLLASVVPLLFLAAVIRERNRATAALRSNEAALRTSYARLRRLAGKLIAAQELERARIARDMHDDFNQQLAALAVSMSSLRQRTVRDQPDLHQVLTALQERTVALTEQVRHFSHNLHPRIVDHVGLAAALRRYCAQMREQRLHVTLTARDDLGEIPRDVALSVYRMAQEALRNVVAHAGVTEATVSIARAPGGLELAIEDRGRGFEPAAAVDGLGLMSIEERSHLFGGSTAIVSAPGRGTRVEVRIPIPPSRPDLVAAAVPGAPR